MQAIWALHNRVYHNYIDTFTSEFQQNLLKEQEGKIEGVAGLDGIYLHAPTRGHLRRVMKFDSYVQILQEQCSSYISESQVIFTYNYSTLCYSQSDACVGTWHPEEMI